MKPEELKAHVQNVLERYPDAKFVIAFSDGNVFLDRDKNAAELHAATSKRTPQRFDREEQAETGAVAEDEDDMKAGSTATDELTGKSDAPAEEPVVEPAPVAEPVEEPAEEPAPAEEPTVEPGPVEEPVQEGDKGAETTTTPAPKGKPKK